MQKNIDPSREYITTSQAAKQSGFSSIYLARLLREGKLEGFQLVREWIVYVDSLEKYLATTHKPGPKGPRTKRQADEHQKATNTSHGKKS
jgi:hypothetical protein